MAEDSGDPPVSLMCENCELFGARHIWHIFCDKRVKCSFSYGGQEISTFFVSIKTLEKENGWGAFKQKNHGRFGSEFMNSFWNSAWFFPNFSGKLQAFIVIPPACGGFTARSGLLRRSRQGGEPRTQRAVFWSKKWKEQRIFSRETNVDSRCFQPPNKLTWQCKITIWDILNVCPYIYIYTHLQLVHFPLSY